MAVLPFRRRAPHQDGESGGGLGLDSNPLRGVSILLVEDDFIVAFDMQTMLEEQGARVIGPAADLSEARGMCVHRDLQIKVAVLDVNLKGEHVFPLALDLQRAGIPFVFVTAYADNDSLFPAELRDVPRLAKPVLPNALLSQLQRLLR